MLTSPSKESQGSFAIVGLIRRLLIGRFCHKALFGTPVGWVLYETNNVIPDAGNFTGILEPNGTDFFNTVAPEGVKVCILFYSGREGEGEYSYEQTLTETLQSNTVYSLRLEVGNIASGTA